MIRFLTSPEPETISRLCSLGLIPGLPVKVLRKIAHGPIVIEMKDTQIALGRDVAESLLVSPRRRERKRKTRASEKGARSRYPRLARIPRNARRADSLTTERSR